MHVRRLLHWSNAIAIAALVWTALLLLSGSPELPWSHWLPAAFYDALNLNNRNDEGRVWHVFFSFVLVGVWTGYLLYLSPIGGRRAFKAQRPEYRFAYWVVGLAIIGEIVTGLPIYLHDWTSFADVLGGQEAIRFEHFVFMIPILAFAALHLFQVATGGWRRFRTMAGYALPIFLILVIALVVVARLHISSDRVPTFLNWARDTAD